MRGGWEHDCRHCGVEAPPLNPILGYDLHSLSLSLFSFPFPLPLPSSPCPSVSPPFRALSASRLHSPSSNPLSRPLPPLSLALSLPSPSLSLPAQELPPLPLAPTPTPLSPTLPISTSPLAQPTQPTSSFGRKKDSKLSKISRSLSWNTRRKQRQGGGREVGEGRTLPPALLASRIRRRTRAAAFQG